MRTIREFCVELQNKICDGNDSLNKRRENTFELLKSWKLGVCELRAIRDYGIKHGFISSGTAAYLFQTLSR